MLVSAAVGPAVAQQGPPGNLLALVAYELPAMTVRGEAEYEGVRQEPFLPPVHGTELYSGKKASVIDLDALPKIQANNYRVRHGSETGTEPVAPPVITPARPSP
jgi:hypothetical protein